MLCRGICKSRAERNEIYYNWIENAGSSGHGWGSSLLILRTMRMFKTGTAREDADVVGMS
jgi:hypothetical protein